MINMSLQKVCLDAQVYIWGIKEESIPEQKQMIDFSKKLFEYLENKNIDVILPTPLITELTWTMDETKREKLTKYLIQRFKPAPFDAVSAIICGKMLSQYVNKPNYAQIKQDIGKRKLKYDALIASIAIKNECDCIFTMDEDFNIAKNFIDIKKIPDNLSLFDAENSDTPNIFNT